MAKRKNRNPKTRKKPVEMDNSVINNQPKKDAVELVSDVVN